MFYFFYCLLVFPVTPAIATAVAFTISLTVAFTFTITVIVHSGFVFITFIRHDDSQIGFFSSEDRLPELSPILRHFTVFELE